MSQGATALVAHSGGPTAVLNASLAGIVDEARHAGVSRLLGARFGIEGMLAGDFVDLFAVPPRDVEAAARASSSALGTSRRPVDDGDLERVMKVCAAHDVRWVFYTGGNGSMATADRLASLAHQAGRSLAVVGVPKTIDNDLAGTDHAPGYPSAARFFACAARDVGADNRALSGQVEILEVLGRNSGWIAAATRLACRAPDDAPQLVYLPERPLPLGRLLDDISRVYSRLGHCTVVVCEGQLDEEGGAFGADVRLTSRGPLATNLGHRLAQLVAARLGLKAHAEKPGLLGRSSREPSRDLDRDEAYRCGQAAVRAARDGASRVMVTLERTDGPGYAAVTGTTPLDRVAGVERRVPLGWIDESGGPLPPLLDYIAPLVGDVAPDVVFRG
jgi:6-phosphofructokinase 1